MAVVITCKENGDSVTMDVAVFEKIRTWLAYHQFFDFGIRLEKIRSIDNLCMPEKEKEKLYHEFYSKTDDMVFSGLITDGFVYFCMHSIDNGHTDYETCGDIMAVFTRCDEDVKNDLHNVGKEVSLFKSILQTCVSRKSDMRWYVCKNSTV